MFKIKTISFLFCLLCSTLCFSQEQGTGDLRVVGPNANTRIESGNDFLIKWANASYSAKNLYRIKIELYKDNQPVTVLTESTFNSGEFKSMLLSTVAPGKYRVKLTAVEGIAHSFSDYFEIIAPIPIKILQPTNQDIWVADRDYKVIWQDREEGAPVYINLFKIDSEGARSSVLKIADGVKNTGEFTFNIPQDLEGGQYQIAIRIPTITETKFSRTFLIEGK